jgi:CxxC-x17-CxxC domain-containing protein
VSKFQDRTLRCSDCGTTYTFTANEQTFYAERGFSEPKRCPSCRAARKASRGGGGGGGGDYSRSGGSGGGGGRDRGAGGGGRAPRQMYDVICDECGKPTQVPFKPRDDRPVYCRDCYDQMH